MAISLKDLKRVKNTLPPRTLIYGPPGMGKTTLANEWPNTVFLQTEQGETTNDELDTFGLLKSYNELIEAIGALYAEDHGFQTVALDSLDKLEPLLWAAVCEANKWDSIESPGYGKGYLAADLFWRDMMEGLNALRRERGMAITFIAHSTVERFDDPRTASYSRFDIRLHKRAIALIEDEVDLIAFINQEATMKEEKLGFNKTRAHAAGGVQRWIYTEGRPSLSAKNRYGMPPKFPYVKGQGFALLAKYFPGFEAVGISEPVYEDQPEDAAAEPVAETQGANKAA